MSDNNKNKEFLQKLSPCIERGELDACVEETARLAREMRIGAKELLDLSADRWEREKHAFVYVISLAVAQDLEREDKAEAYSLAGSAAQYLGKLKESEELLKKAIGLDPKNAATHNNYAVLLQEFGRKSEAEKHYKKAIEINPELVEPHSNYAVLLGKLGRKKEAEEHYKKAIELDPNNTAVHSNYANLLRETSRFDEAEKEVRTALQFNPTNPYALSTLGDILACEDYFEEAKKEYQRALENSASMKLSPISEIHNNLGWVYEQLKQYDKAGEEFKRAKNLDPMNVKAIRNLRKLGKVEAVIETCKFQKCLAIKLLLLLSITFSYYLFWINKLTETVFATYSTILIAMLIFVFFIHYIIRIRFEAGPSGIKFELSTEHRIPPIRPSFKFEHSP